MKKLSNDILLNMKADHIGTGSEKKVYLKKGDPSRCIKISLKEKSKQILREIIFFNRLSKKQSFPYFVPKYYGSFQTPDFIGYEQECFLERSNGGFFDVAMPLSTYIENYSDSIQEIQREIYQLKYDMLSSLIVCSDLHGENVYKTIQNGNSRLVVIDGYGYPELIPIYRFVKYFARKKILRQWEKFENRIAQSYKINSL